MSAKIKTQPPAGKRQRTPEEHALWKRATTFKVLAVAACIALILQTGLFLLALFEPPLPYTISDTGGLRLDSAQFIRALEALTSGHLHRNNRVQVLTNGENFYPAELEAIRGAKSYVNIECYIFSDGKVTDQVLAALTERAKAGVQVRLLTDAIGSATFPQNKFDPLRDAGGKVALYHPVRWYTWPRINNRTHRELMVVDGEVGFAGGAGFADHWLIGSGKNPRWRDMMVRVEGGAVTGLESTFSENWLEASGEILLNPRYFPAQKADGPTEALVVSSSPTMGRSTQARILVQSLLAAAGRQIHITSPYFVPDSSLIGEIARAIEERHVEVKIIVPGRKSDHLLTRRSSRRIYGDLLKAGAKIYEYRPSMIHVKSLVVDGEWSVVGSTNMDSRSFGLNDELSVAMLDPELAARLEEDFQRDLGQSREVSYEEWRKRPLLERIEEKFGQLLERQQ